MGTPIIREDTVLSITDSDYSTAHTDPLNNLSHTHFHSSLDYLEIFYDQEATINFPYRGNSFWNTYATKWSMPNHNLGYIPGAILILDNYATPTGLPIFRSGITSRSLSLEVTDNSVNIIEKHCVGNTSDLPPQSITCKVILFRVIEADPSNPYLVYIDPPNKKFSLANGRIDETKRILQVNESEPLFHLNSGLTADNRYNAVRVGTADGGFSDYGAYTGSFTPTGYGVSDVGRAYSDGKMERVENGNIAFGDENGTAIFSTENPMPCYLGEVNFPKQTINIPSNTYISGDFFNSSNRYVNVNPVEQIYYDFDLGPAPEYEVDFILARAKINQTGNGNYYGDAQYGGWHFPFDIIDPNYSPPWESLYGTFILQQWNYFQTIRLGRLMIDNGRWIFRVMHSNSAVSRKGSSTWGHSNYTNFDVEFHIKYGKFMGVDPL